ncbi:MAG: type VII toxin-antitoxin system MntA family adenylyltransferase antitoxin [Candidatus Thorarchaeota archaeon]
MQPHDIKKVIAMITPIMENETNVTAAYIFGSVARDTETAMSNLDIAVLLDDNSEELSLTLTKELNIRISELLDFLDVDLIVLNHADVAIKYNIVQHGVLFYDRDPYYRLQFERWTWDEYAGMQRIWKEYDRLMLQRILEDS